MKSSVSTTILVSLATTLVTFFILTMLVHSGHGKASCCQGGGHGYHGKSHCGAQYSKCHGKRHKKACEKKCKEYHLIDSTSQIQE